MTQAEFKRMSSGDILFTHAPNRPRQGFEVLSMGRTSVQVVNQYGVTSVWNFADALTKKLIANAFEKKAQQ